MSPVKRIRAAFMGSSPLSCRFLKALQESDAIDVALVVTQPDRCKGRHLQVEAGPVKAMAREQGIPVITPASVNAQYVLETVAGLGIDVIVVMAYGQFLGEYLLNMPPLGCVNLHVSILPKWRGAAPIQRAILAGDKETGVSAMLMDAGMDTGDVLGTVSCPISATDTADTLGDTLSISGAKLMVDVLLKLAAGTCPRVKQDSSLATFAKKIKNQEEWLDWSLSAAENERKVRAFSGVRGASTFFPGVDGKPGMRVKVQSAEVEPLPQGMARALPGTLLELDKKKGPLVAGGAGKALRLTMLLPEGKPRPMTGGAFANGYRARIPIGIRLEKCDK